MASETITNKKHNALTLSIESIYSALEKIKTDQQELGITQDFQLDLVWLRESNEKLRKDVSKVSEACTFIIHNSHVYVCSLHLLYSHQTPQPIYK